MARRCAVALCGGVLALSGLLVSAPPASAATSCGGDLVRVQPIKAGPKVIGELQLYWNAALQRNCAITKHGGDTWGVKLDTLVVLFECQETSPGPNCTYRDSAADRGDYKYQAGPVSLHVGKHCVYAVGNIRWKGESHQTGIDGQTGNVWLTARFC